MTLTPLTPPPTAPSRSDPPETFITRADAFVAWWSNTLVPEMNALLPAIVIAGSATNYSATSTTSVAIGTGSKSLTVQIDKAFTVGQFVVIASTATPANYMAGQVTSYNSATGALVVNVTATGGSGTITSWSISLAPVSASYLPLAGGALTGGLSGTTVVAQIGSGSIAPITGTSNLANLPSGSFTNNGSGSSVFGITSSITNGGNNTSSYHFSGITQGVAIWYQYGNGSSSYTSDARTKQNIRPARTNYLDDLMKLQVVKFDRRAAEDIDLEDEGPMRLHKEGDPEPKEIGLLAQDAEKVFPGLVEDALHDLDGNIFELGEDGEPLCDDYGEPIMSKKTKSKVLKGDVIYGPIMLASLQEHVRRTASLIAKLQARITALEGQ